MTTFALKLIASLCMLIDHIGMAFPSHYVLNIIARLSNRGAYMETSRRKMNMRYMSAVLLTLAFTLTACADSGAMVSSGPLSSTENSAALSSPSEAGSSQPLLETPQAEEGVAFYGDPAFLEKAYALGYSDKQLEYLKNSGIPKDRVLNLSEDGNGLSSSNGRYILGGYEVNFLVICMFLYDTETSKAMVLPDWQNGYSDFNFISNDAFYASVQQVGGADYEAGIRFYKVTSPQEPYALWNLTNSTVESDRIRILLDAYKLDDADLLLAFWCETPVEWGGWIQDDSESYRITLLDYDGAVVREFDTEIPLGTSKTGIAGPSFEKPNLGRTPIPGVVYFDIGDVSYQCDYKNGTVSTI